MGGEVIITHPRIFTAESHYKNIQGGAYMTLPPGYYLEAVAGDRVAVDRGE
jgi:hypothetical protein